MKAMLATILMGLTTLPVAGDALNWTPLPELPSELGVAGPFVGVHDDELIVAGGANFPKPVWDNGKVWHNDVYVLPLKDGGEWSVVGQLPKPLGYGATVSVEEGVICIGGNDATTVYADVFLLTANGETEALPTLPTAICYGSATRLGDHIYLVGGTTSLTLDSATQTFWRLDWSKRAIGGNQFIWENVEPWPGSKRAFNMTVTQHNGNAACLYVMGGRYENEAGETIFCDDVYEYNPARTSSPWRKRATMPLGLSAGTVAAIGQSHIMTLAGADISLHGKADELKDNHPGFPKQIFVYHTITDTWVQSGELPANQVTTTAVPWGENVLLASGEVRPRVRTKAVWKISPTPSESGFAAANWLAILLYLGVVMGIGFFFARRNKNTDDFFRGGQRIPGWVAGLSIFATLLSSITFVATPARAFATDWSFILINAGILFCAPLIAFFVLPKFRRINATSAYEYLEERFNLGIRLFASASFVLFQIGRMAIVMYLPALALAAITPLSLEWCIIIMGVMSIIYCSLGGFEAVVWTDALQAIVLLGGAFISFGLILYKLQGGWSEFTTVAIADSKLRWADFDWSSSSYMAATFWVVVISGLGQSIIPYSSDQAVVQRYVSTPTEGKARSAIWLNAGLSMVGTLLFFGLGTALYVFYKANPGSLDPSFKTDSILPLFISRELPIGIAGIVIAAIFAAAQSTISTSMNSTSTAIVTDFFRRLGWQGSEKQYLRLARILTVVLGLLGTVFALILAVGNIESAWKTFMMVIGFVMGPLCGVFLLGMFTKSANSTGAIAAAIGGVTALLCVKYLTQTSGLLYAPIGIIGAFSVGIVTSQLFGSRNSSSTEAPTTA